METLVQQSRAPLIVELTGLALAAPDVPSAVTPMLDSFVDRTAAEGAAYFQLGGAVYFARAASGMMPDCPVMEAILAHGLPVETPLMRALDGAPEPLFFSDTGTAPETAGFPELGVASMAAAPVRDAAGGLLGAFLMHTFDAHDWTSSEAGLFAAVSGAMAALAARLVAEESAVAAQEGAIRALGLALESRDGDIAGHTDRVTSMAVRIGQQLGLNDRALKELRWGAYLHDIGKIRIPDAILLKPGRLDDAEWARMREHAELGYRFANELAFLPGGARDLIRSHHERWDGAGYPQGRVGNDIPLPARIFAVCDVYDALVSERCYKPAWSRAEAVAEIQSQAGRQFDPAVVEAFLAAELGE